MKHYLKIGVCLLTMMLWGACVPGNQNEKEIHGTDQAESVEREVSNEEVNSGEKLVGEISETAPEEAILLSMNFETDMLPITSMEDEKWTREIDNDENGVLCNTFSDDWLNFHFGKEAWTNYAVSMNVIFRSQASEQSAEIYARINTSTEGYRANLQTSRWMGLSYFPPTKSLGEKDVEFPQDDWNRVIVKVFGETIQVFLNDIQIISVEDETRAAGMAGFGVAPGTIACVDDVLVWNLDLNGAPLYSPGQLKVQLPGDDDYSIQEKVANKPTIPVFFPWATPFEDLGCGWDTGLFFDCDRVDRLYALVWTGEGRAGEVDGIMPTVSVVQKALMQSDRDTLYLVSDEWHYWNTNWEYLSPDSPFYLTEVFRAHEGSEYGHTLMINFEHIDWPERMANKARAYKDAGFDGLMLDWWGNSAGNGRPEADVESARLAIARAIREQVGDDFILMGNVNWQENDPTAAYLSGAFLELWKPGIDSVYPVNKSDEGHSNWQSIEYMEDLLVYWNTHLAWPRIIAFEPWKITRDNHIDDRLSDENLAYARLFTAMVVVIPENGYILYADNNDDWDGGDHQHAYYDFYTIDFGQPASEWIEARAGVGYKLFESGVIAYNRTENDASVTMQDGFQFKVDALDGVFLAR